MPETKELRVEVAATILPEIDNLAAHQNPRTGRGGFVEAILAAVVAACEADGDPEAWRRRLATAQKPPTTAAKRRD